MHCDTQDISVCLELQISCYRPRSEARDGHVFTGICLSNSGGGEEWTTPPPPARVKGHNTSLPPWTTPPSPRTTPPPQTTPPPPRTTPFSLPLDNTSLPPARVKGHNISLPPGQDQRSQHLPLPLDNTSLPPPWTTPPSPPARVKGHNTPSPTGTMHRRAVRIILECILVTDVCEQFCGIRSIFILFIRKILQGVNWRYTFFIFTSEFSDTPIESHRSHDKNMENVTIVG